MARRDELADSARSHADPVLALLDLFRNTNSHDRRLLLRYLIAAADYVESIDGTLILLLDIQIFHKILLNMG